MKLKGGKTMKNKSEEFLAEFRIECDIEHILDHFTSELNNDYAKNYTNIRNETVKKIIDYFKNLKRK